MVLHFKILTSQSTMKSLNLKVKIFFTFLLILGTVAAVPLLYEGLDGREYIIEPELKYNWFEAWHECARRNAELVTIDSEEKNNAIMELVQRLVGKSHNLWLGGNDELNSSRNQGRNQSFVWSATGRKFTFTFWSDNQPDNYKGYENCVHIWDQSSLYQWNDAGCRIKMGFICEENHYLQLYNEKLKNECRTGESLQTEFLLNFQRLHNESLSQLNDSLHRIEEVDMESKLEIQKLQIITLNGIKEILNSCGATLNDKILKHINDLKDVILGNLIALLNDSYRAVFEKVAIIT